MTKETELQLVFNTDQGKKKIIVVDNPRADVSKDEAEAAMQVLIEKDIFESTTGKLASIDEMRLHTCNSQPLA